MAAIMVGTRYDYKKATGDISANIAAMYPSGPVTVIDIDNAQGPNPGFKAGDVVNVSYQNAGFTAKVQKVVIYPNYWSLWLEGNGYTGPTINDGKVTRAEGALKSASILKPSGNSMIYIGVAALVIAAGAFLWFKYKKGKK